jgi:hypothetical protein
MLHPLCPARLLVGSKNWTQTNAVFSDQDEQAQQRQTNVRKDQGAFNCVGDIKQKGPNFNCLKLEIFQ